MTSQFTDLKSSSFFLTLFRFACKVYLLVQVSCQYHHWFLTIFYKGLTINLEIGNTPVWVLPNIWGQVQVIDTKFGGNVSNKIYWRLENARVGGFTASELLRENQQMGKFIPTPSQVRVNGQNIVWIVSFWWKVKISPFRGFQAALKILKY